MGFAGKVWRLLVGIKDALALLFLLLFFGVLFAALAARPNPGAVREGALLLQLDGVVVEEVAPVDPLAVLLADSLPLREYAARDLVHAIDAAAEDDRIRLLALDLSTFLGGGQVHLREVADAIARFRRSGKPVHVYALAYADDALLLAAEASEVWVDPMGGAAVRGPGGARLYYGAALDRFNINARVFRVGTYKSAVEPYLGNGMSPEARENTAALLDAVWEDWQDRVKKARPRADLARMTGDYPALLAASGGDLARAAQAAGLVDKIGTYEDWGKAIAEVAGTDEWNDAPGAFAYTEYDPWLAEIAPSRAERLADGAPIGVITIAGEIVDDMSGPGSAGATRIEQLLDDALDADFKALVVRIDSPGGTVTGSETIRRAVLRHKARGIPVIISMGNYAASGGYWIATAGEQIFAEPTTLTGSIGVFLVVPTFEDALAEYGVTSDGVRTTPLSGQPDLLAGFTPETEALLQAETNAVYARFLGLVAEARDLSRARADELGQGRVWTGGAARQLGLVDRLGGLDDALAYAAERAGLAEGSWHPVYLGGGGDPYAPLLAQLGGGAARVHLPQSLSGMVAGQEAALWQRLGDDLDLLLRARGVQARCLECPAAPALATRGDISGLHSWHEWLRAR